MFQLYKLGRPYARKSASLILSTFLVLSVILSPQLISAQTNPSGCNFLSRIGGVLSTKGAEIPAFHPGSKRVYSIAGPVVEFFLMSATGSLSYGGELPFGFVPAAGNTAIPNSIAVYNNILAASYAVVNTTTRAQLPGRVTFYNATTGAVLNSVGVGFLPDMITFTQDGTKLITADEGEPNSYNQSTSFDPMGSVSIVNLAGGVASATVQIVNFMSYNAQIATLRASGVRIYGPNATVAQDLEPEYIAISPDGLTVWVTLQENNAFALVDLATATVTSIIPLGLKNHSLPGSGLDASDRDLEPTFTSGKSNIQNWPVFGMYQPDAIAQFTSGGQAYYITANEGDSRDYNGYSEEVRVGANTYVLDPGTFLNAATLKQVQNLGRLTASSATGNPDGDGDFDQIHIFGARSFSIWNSSGLLVFDSGDQLEQITKVAAPTLFNSDGAASSFDQRSDNKGPEPEGVTTGVINGVTYAFIGLERIGDIMVYNVSNPLAPVFIQYINTPADRGVEGLVFVSAVNSPTGKPLLITAAEATFTISVYEVNIPLISVTENSGLVNDGVICAGSSVTLTAAGSGPFLWNTGATTQSITVTPTLTSTYTVTSCTLSDDQVIVVNQLPVCLITAVPENNIFTGGVPTNLYLGYGPQKLTLQLAMPATAGPFTYAWSGGSLSNNSIANPVFSATVPGVFTFTVAITNSLGCTSTCSISITVTDIRDGNKNKVFICHNGHSQSVSVNAVPAHLAHGDQLGNCNAGRSSVELIASQPASLIFPNPAASFVNVDLEGQTGEVLVTVRDINNKIVLPVVKRVANSAKSTLRLNTSSLINGTYFVSISTNSGQSKSYRLIVIH